MTAPPLRVELRPSKWARGKPGGLLNDGGERRDAVGHLLRAVGVEVLPGVGIPTGAHCRALAGVGLSRFAIARLIAANDDPEVEFDYVRVQRLNLVLSEAGARVEFVLVRE